MNVSLRSVVGFLTGVVVAGLLMLQAAEATPKRTDDADARRQCRGNLMRVGEVVYAAARDLGPDDDTGEGWFIAKLMDTRDRALVSRLQCPADPLAGTRDESLGYRATLSYPVRALDTHRLVADRPAADEPQVLVVCPHHDDGAFVMTDDFDIRFLTRAELGAPESGPIEIGAKGTHPALACVRYEKRLPEEMERAIRTRQAQISCANHLRQLGGIYTSEAMEKPGLPPHSGPALLVYYRQRHYIQKTREAVMICPLDPIVHAPATETESAAYDELDLRKSLRRYASYAVRDFMSSPLNSRAERAQSIMACLHHQGGANVLFDDGAVQFLDRERLGLGPDDPITVGSASKSELLRPLILEPSEKE